MAPFARVDICRTFFRVPFRWNLVKFRIAREKMKIRFRRARKGCIEAESNVLVQVWIFQRSDLPTVMRLNKLSKDTDTLSMVFARPKKRHIIHCSLTTSINYPVDMHINYLVFCWAASVRAQLDFHSISSDSLATFSLLRFNKQPFLWTFSSLPNENVESLSRFFVLEHKQRYCTNQSHCKSCSQYRCEHFSIEMGIAMAFEILSSKCLNLPEV